MSGRLSDTDKFPMEPGPPLARRTNKEAQEFSNGTRKQKQKQTIHNKVKVIVVTGAIGAGKTTTLNKIVSIVESRGIESDIKIFLENTAEWEFYLKKFYENRAAYGYLLQMDVLLHFHRVTRELHKLEESGKPITVFVERSPYDIIHVFLESNKDFYNDDMYRSLIRMTEEYCNLKVWKDASYVILNSPSELCISRIRERDRDGECNIDREYVIMICNAYKDMAKMFGAGIQHLDNTGKITDTALALLDMYKI